MTSSLKLSQICKSCELGGECCRGAMPPLTCSRIKTLLEKGVNPDAIEHGRYKRLKLKPDGYCVLFEGGVGCTIHEFKPETCVSGPFTFDIKGSVLEIYLKKESICPMVRALKEDGAAYEEQYAAAVSMILDLIRELPKDELAEILKIEEPETVKVAEIRLEG